MELLGLPLLLALELLRDEPGNATPVIVETAPPFIPKNRIPIWGEARVLRVSQRDGYLELLVARELLGEEKPSEPGFVPVETASPPQAI